MFGIEFLCPKNVKEMEKKQGEKKDGFGAERNGLQTSYCFKWNLLLLF